MKLLSGFLLILAASSAAAADGNRLTFLDDSSPYWPKPDSAKLVTPQWVGEPGVEAVVILAIDDLRETSITKAHEPFLRPIIARLKQIDGHAPISIMTNTVSPDDPQLAAWLSDGLSIESHTLTHPCPCLGKLLFDEAARDYHGSVDLLSSIPGNHPVAFRMPCCDSMNSGSPRFFSEIFNRVSPQGRWLAIDSSVFTLPPGERFPKYQPQTLRPPMKLAFDRLRRIHRRLSVSLRDRETMLGVSVHGAERLGVVQRAGPKAPALLEDWKAALDHVVKSRASSPRSFIRTAGARRSSGWN